MKTYTPPAVKTFATKSNARRAAKVYLGADATEGTDYEITEAANGHFGFRVLHTAKEETPQATPEAKPAETNRKKSAIANPVKQVWAIADRMAGAKRKDIIAKCVEE